jgi:hypothetical protein
MVVKQAVRREVFRWQSDAIGFVASPVCEFGQAQREGTEKLNTTESAMTEQTEQP